MSLLCKLGLHDIKYIKFNSKTIQTLTRVQYCPNCNQIFLRDKSSLTETKENDNKQRKSGVQNRRSSVRPRKVMARK